MHDINTLYRDNRVLNIFTDRSIIEDYVEAAAVASKLKKGRLCYIGTEEMTTVFRVKLQEIVMATVMTMTIKKTQGQNL